MSNEPLASEPLASAGSLARKGAAKTNIAQSTKNGIEFLFNPSAFGGISRRPYSMVYFALAIDD
jgi:hypothetical protein